VGKGETDEEKKLKLESRKFRSRGEKEKITPSNQSHDLISGIG